jgi:S1-C subfamily serine protease
MEDNNGQPLSLGSGFVLRGDLVATNYHVIKGASAGHVRLVGAKITMPIQGVVAKDAYLDLAILKVSGLQAAALKLASAESCSRG